MKPMPRPSLKALIRFCKNIALSRSNECWEWSGSLVNNGYGNFSFRTTTYSAHRLAYLIHHGVDPLDKFVCHTCDNRRCVNPKHLFLGDPRENQVDCVKKGRSASAKLNPTKVRQIRGLLASRCSAEDIAKSYGVHVDTIYKIKHRKQWSHVI